MKIMKVICHTEYLNCDQEFVDKYIDRLKLNPQLQQMCVADQLKAHKIASYSTTKAEHGVEAVTTYRIEEE